MDSVFKHNQPFLFTKKSSKSRALWPLHWHCGKWTKRRGVPQVSSCSGCLTLPWAWCTTLLLCSCLVWLCFLFVCFFPGRVSLCSPGCAGTHSIDQAGLNSQRSICLCFPKLWKLRWAPHVQHFIFHVQHVCPSCVLYKLPNHSGRVTLPYALLNKP